MDEPSRFRSVFEDLKRRKVFRSVAAYVVVAWLLVQIADIVLPAFGAPEWSIRALITLLVLGFPIILVLSWLLDVSPEGVRVTLGTTRPPWSRLAVAIPIIGLTMVAVWWIWDGYLGEQPRWGHAVPKTTPVVAVSRFENLTGSDRLDWLGKGLANLVRDSLAESRHLIVVSKPRWDAILRTADDMEMTEAAARAGIDYVLSGEYFSTPGGLVLTARVSDVEAGQNVLAQRLDQLVEGTLLASSNRLAMLTKQSLQVPHTENVAVFAADFAVENMAAYEAYLGGLEYFVRFDYHDAEQAFESALELAPDFDVARYRLAHLRWAAGRPEDAHSTIDQIPEDTPLSPRERLYVQGARALFDRDYESAKKIYRELLDEYPYEVEAREFLAEVHWLAYEGDAALAELHRLVEQEPENEVLWSYLGETYVELGRLDEARAALDRYLELAPEDPFGFSVLGQLHQLQGHSELATENYRRALALDPDFRRAQLGLAQSYAFLGRDDEAESLWREIAENPTVTPSYRIDAAFDLSALLRSQGRFEESLAPLQQLEIVIEQEQIREAMAVAVRGLIHLELGNVAEARRLVDLSVERSPAVPTRYLYARGLLDVETGALDAAQATAAEIRSHALPSDDPDRTEDKAAAYIEGMALFYSGDLMGSVERMREAVELQGYRYALYQLGLAAVLHANGEHAEAARIAGEATADRDPGDMRMDLELDRVRALLLEARIRAEMGQVDEAHRLATQFLEVWHEAPEAHPDLVMAKSIVDGT